MYKGYAFNCTFKDNIAENSDYHSEAMYEGTACLCSFNGDSRYDTKIIHATIDVLDYISTYKSGEKLIFNLTAKDEVLYGFNTTIEIYKNDSLVKTVDVLSGEEWIVDLGPGEYTAVLSLTGRSDVESSNANINVSKGITTIDISPISYVTVGEEVIINYTTNSNGTVVIRVNGQKINGAKFTATKEGVYNVSVEVAENDYYTAASNNTIFNVTLHVFKLSENKNLSPLYSVATLYKVLVTCDGQAVRAGEIVTIKFNGKTYSVKTDSKGYATLFFNATVKPKAYTITAEYKGVIVFNKIIVKSIINAKNIKVKKTKKVNILKVSLKNVMGQSLVGKVLKIKIGLKTYKVKTDKNRTATLKIKRSMIKNFKIGKTYRYRVSYGKDSVTKKLSIKK